MIWWQLGIYVLTGGLLCFGIYVATHLVILEVAENRRRRKEDA